MLCCMSNADVDWQRDLGILCYGDSLEGRLFNMELYATVTFIRLHNGVDLKVQIIYRRMRNYVIITGDSKERTVTCFFINVC
jgi:hypothetical protein